MKEEWLKQGYEDFAIYGPDKLSINNIAKSIGASRSNFYHYFGEMEIFIDELLARHWEVCMQYEREGKDKCKVLVPDLYRLLASYPIPLRFSLQLFRHRDIPKFNYLFLKSYQSSAEAFLLELFEDHLNLQLPESEQKKLWMTLGESWYSRIDVEDLSAESLQRHAQEIMESISALVQSDIFTMIKKTG